MPHPRFIDMTGQRVGALTVLRKAGNRKSGAAIWECLCVCGKTIQTPGVTLRRGQVSCGCVGDAETGKRSAVQSRRHGMHGTRVYKIWGSMRDRCADKKNRKYGGKGITVCAAWAKFEKFYSWATSAGYTDDLSIDRINNSLGYSPDNCRWVPIHQQSANRRNVAKAPDGTPWTHIARKNGIKGQTYHSRIHMGWTHERAATEPLQR